MNIKFTVAEGIGPENEAQIRDGLQIAADFLKETYDVVIPVPPVQIISFIRNFDALKTNSNFGCATGTVDKMVFNVGDPCWTQILDISVPTSRKKIAVHEFVHTWQDTLGCVFGKDGPIGRTPPWFFEGMAEYLAQKSIAQYGLTSTSRFNSYVLSYAQQAKKTRDKLKLADVDSGTYTVEQGQYFLPFALTGVAQLVDNHGGLPKLREFCTRAGVSRSGWTAAFAEVFGLTREEFYAEFERYLDRL